MLSKQEPQMSRLQSLPTALTTKELDALLASFPKAAQIDRHDDVATVRAPNGAKVFSAIMVRDNTWHAMAAPGLITATVQGVAA